MQHILPKVVKVMVHAQPSVSTHVQELPAPERPIISHLEEVPPPSSKPVKNIYIGVPEVLLI